MKKLGAIIGLSFLSVLVLAIGCGPSGTTQDPEILTQRARFMLTAEPQGAISVADAKTAVEKGEPVVLIGRVNAGEVEPWDEGHAAFVITDASTQSQGNHQHDHGDHAHAGDHTDHGHGEEHAAHDDDHDHGHGEKHDAHDHDHGDEEKHEAHDDDKGHDDEHSAHEHDHDGAHDHEHASDDEHKHEPHEDGHKREHQHDDHGHAHAADGHQGHDHENCAFCDHAKSSVESQAIVQFVDERGERLPIDARKLFGIKKDQLVVVRGRGKNDDVMGLIISADGIYIRD